MMMTGHAPKPRGRRKKVRAEPIRPFCPECHKQFSNQSALTKHKLTHSDERKFACQQCSKAFKRHDHLTGHMQTHSNRKPFNCTIQGCDKTYCDARSLRRHKENIHHIVTQKDSSSSSSGGGGGGSNTNSNGSSSATAPTTTTTSSASSTSSSVVELSSSSSSQLRNQHLNHHQLISEHHSLPFANSCGNQLLQHHGGGSAHCVTSSTDDLQAPASNLLRSRRTATPASATGRLGSCDTIPMATSNAVNSARLDINNNNTNTASHYDHYHNHQYLHTNGHFSNNHHHHHHHHQQAAPYSADYAVSQQQHFFDFNPQHLASAPAMAAATADADQYCSQTALTMPHSADSIADSGTFVHYDSNQQISTPTTAGYLTPTTLHPLTPSGLPQTPSSAPPLPPTAGPYETQPAQHHRTSYTSSQQQQATIVQLPPPTFNGTTSATPTHHPHHQQQQQQQQHNPTQLQQLQPSGLFCRRIQRLRSDPGSGQISTTPPGVTCAPLVTSVICTGSSSQNNNNQNTSTDHYQNGSSNNTNNQQHASYSADYASTQHFSFDHQNTPMERTQQYSGTFAHYDSSPQITPSTGGYLTPSGHATTSSSAQNINTAATTTTNQHYQQLVPHSADYASNQHFSFEQF